MNICCNLCLPDDIAEEIRRHRVAQLTKKGESLDILASMAICLEQT